MKWNQLAVGFLVACLTTWETDKASAVVYRVAFSPPASQALNLGSTIYPGDHAPGLSALNEGAVVASTATGGVLGGMSFDSTSGELTMDFGYGSAFGFNDLVSDWNGGIHIHGNGTNTAQFPNPNTNAGVAVNLAGIHTSSGLRSGRVTGSVPLDASQQTWLFDNQLYVNIHSAQFGPGEIRGQLVVVPEPSGALLLMMGVSGLLIRRRR